MCTFVHYCQAFLQPVLDLANILFQRLLFLLQCFTHFNEVLLDPGRGKPRSKSASAGFTAKRCWSRLSQVAVSMQQLARLVSSAYSLFFGFVHSSFFKQLSSVGKNFCFFCDMVSLICNYCSFSFYYVHNSVFLEKLVCFFFEKKFQKL